MDDLSIKKINFNNDTLYVIYHNRSIVSGGYLHGYLQNVIELKAERLNRLGELGGEIKIIKGKNAIVFKQKKCAADAILYLNSLRVLDELAK